MRTLLYLDAETLPSHDPAIREQIAGEIKPPGSMKKAETIAAWEAEEKPAAIEKAVCTAVRKPSSGAPAFVPARAA